MKFVQITLFCILSACCYGIANDLVTAHVCVEYFLPPAHPILVPTTSPLLLALVWGVAATWWFGLLLGVPLAIVCRMGAKPKLTVRHIARPVFFVLAIVFAASMLFGAVGFFAGQLKWVWLVPPFSDAVTPERHALFLFALWGHGAGYVLGAIGGGMLIAFAWLKRQAKAKKAAVNTAADAVSRGNLFANLPELLPDEVTEVLVSTKNIRIERIVSTGQGSPPGFWYDQTENEWVTVLKGEAELEFAEPQERQRLRPGDCVLIPARQKHRVAWTMSHEPTVWLAVFFDK